MTVGPQGNRFERDNPELGLNLVEFAFVNLPSCQFAFDLPSLTYLGHAT